MGGRKTHRRCRYFYYDIWCLLSIVMCTRPYYCWLTLFIYLSKCWCSDCGFLSFTSNTQHEPFDEKFWIFVTTDVSLALEKRSGNDCYLFTFENAKWENWSLANQNSSFSHIRLFFGCCWSISFSVWLQSLSIVVLICKLISFLSLLFAECLFGKTLRELGSTWYPDLGPPNGVLYCKRCECVPVSGFSCLYSHFA